MMTRRLPILIIMVWLLLLGVQVRFVLQSAWSPIDELAHMDYILKLDKGKWPVLHQFIEPELRPIVYAGEKRKLQDFSEAGLVAYSYQAKHPPGYYLVMLIPYKFIKHLPLTFLQQWRVLRVMNYFFIVAGLFSFCLIYRELIRQGFHLSWNLFWVTLLLCQVFILHERYGLGNNALSPLIIHVSGWQLLLYRRTGSISAALAACLGLLASWFIAWTNIFLVPLAVLCLLFMGRKRSCIWPFLFLALGFLLGLGYWYLHRSLSGATAPESQWIHQVIHTVFKANQIGFAQFLQLWLNDWLSLDYLSISFSMVSMMVLLFLFHLLLHLYWIIRYKDSLALGLLFLSLYFLILLFVLNRFVDDVAWVALRHFLGFFPMLVFAFTYGLGRMLSGRKV